MGNRPVIYSKRSLIVKLKRLAKMGWVKNARFGNHGGIGNTVEDYLQIKENNLPIPNAAEWELKAQRINSGSLCTLFHMEPSPRGIKFVPKIFLPMYGWAHQEDGGKYKKGEMSFRQTIHGASRSDRGFMVKIDRDNKRVLISFDSKAASKRHGRWLMAVKKKAGLKELSPQPYWGFDDLKNKAGTKLLNSFYVQADARKIRGVEYYNYSKIRMLEGFDFEKFLKGIVEGKIFVDFDARTGHNHGTKFRTKETYLPELYKKVKVIL